VVTAPGAFADGCQNSTGAVAGGQAGYRTQSYGWVFGVEGQVDWSGLNNSRVSNAFFFAAPGDAINRARTDVFVLFTGTGRYAWGHTLLYFKGGGAVLTGRYNDVLAGSGGVGFYSAGNARGWHGRGRYYLMNVRFGWPTQPIGDAAVTIGTALIGWLCFIVWRVWEVR
jgi:outer membrane immunogenic protein